MKLAYCIPGKVYWIHDFLGRDMYQGLHHAIFKSRHKLNLHEARTHWDPHLTAHVKSPLKVEVKEYAPFETLKVLLKHNPYCPVKSKVDKIHTIIHCLEKNSAIQWHDDGNYTYGATYYLNNRWHNTWGGEFMFKIDKSHGFIEPRGNSLVIVKTPVQHKVNAVTSPILPRVSIQMFVVGGDSKK